MSLQAAIKKRFSGFSLDVSLNTDGGVMGILGASGSGKSMTLKCIAGIETPDEGRIVLNGRVLFDSEKRINLPPQKRKVGYLFQNYALFPNMTVETNIAAGLSGSKEEKQEAAARMIRLFKLEGLEKRYPSQLSGGQQQRVALARILVYEPDANTSGNGAFEIGWSQTVHQSGQNRFPAAGHSCEYHTFSLCYG